MTDSVVAAIEAPVVARFSSVMGTVVSIEVVPGEIGEFAAERAIEGAFGSLEAADEVFSLWKPESALSRLRAGLLEPSETPAVIGKIVDLCRSARDLSGGWFDPWNIGEGFDPTGLVKGWAAEEALRLLVANGAAAALVNAGGDIASTGHAPAGGSWRVGVRHPWRSDSLACVVAVDAAIATSGCYERGPHLVSPFDRSPSPDVSSASVTGPSLAIADALATALAVGGSPVLERIAQLDGYEGYMIGSAGAEEATCGFPFAPSSSADTEELCR